MPDELVDQLFDKYRKLGYDLALVRVSGKVAGAPALSLPFAAEAGEPSTRHDKSAASAAAASPPPSPGARFWTGCGRGVLSINAREASAASAVHRAADVLRVREFVRLRALWATGGCVTFRFAHLFNSGSVRCLPVVRASQGRLVA